MSDLLQFLTGGISAPNPTDQTFYSQLGKQAADEFVEHGTDMNQTISKLAATQSLNEEQVRRVVEAANNSAFGALFRKEAGYVTFPVADVQQVVGGKQRKVKVAAERPHPLVDVSTDALAVQLFGEGCLEKVAEEKEPVDIVDITHQVRHAADQVEDAQTDALKKLAQLQNLAHEMVSTEQAGRNDIQRALCLVGHGEDLAKLACAKLPNEADTSVFGGEILVDSTHPLMEKAAEFTSALKTYVAEKGKFARFAAEVQSVL